MRTPPLGFSESCLGGAESTRLNASELQTVASAFVSTGLAALGHTSMNLDDSWELLNRSASGALLPDPAKFPQGIKPLRDWLHARNLSLGLYTSDAERSCKVTAGSLFHESQDAASLERSTSRSTSSRSTTVARSTSTASQSLARCGMRSTGLGGT